MLLLERRPPTSGVLIVVVLFGLVVFSILWIEPIKNQSPKNNKSFEDGHSEVETNAVKQHISKSELQLNTLQNKDLKTIPEANSVVPSLQANFASKLPDYDAVSAGQPLYGPDAVTIQSSKPLSCAKWHGPVKKSGASVEVRLDQAINNKSHWAQDVQRAVSRCGNGEPMMKINEYGLIYALLRPGDLMLEWGSGKSSCVWAQKVGVLHSIEDDSGWVNMLYRQMNLGVNQMIHWMPPNNRVPYRTMGSWELYNAYIKLPLAIGPTCYPIANNIKFDVILVDGRARPQCAYQALLLLKPHGVLLLHDFETISTPRPYYRIVMRWYELLHLEGSLAVFRIKPGKSGVEYYADPGSFPRWWTKVHSAQEFQYPHRLPHEEPFDKVTASLGSYSLIRKQWTSM